jgi:hypothetical protein
MSVNIFYPFPENAPHTPPYVRPNYSEETRTIAIPALAADLTVDASNIGTVLPWLPGRVEAEIIGPDEIGINSKEIAAGGLTVNGDVTYHFRGVPAGNTHSLQLTFHR